MVAVITSGSLLAPTVLAIIKERGRPFTSSYEEEKSALHLAINWLANCEANTRVAICSDSQSLLSAIQHDRPEVHSIRRALDGLQCSTTLQWVPGHTDVPGNELAEEAKAAAQIRDLPRRPISFAGAKSFLYQHISDPPIQHGRIAASYQLISHCRDRREVVSRSDATLLAQIRSGHRRLFRVYHNVVDRTINPICPLCNACQHTLEHWLLECIGTVRARMEIFGRVELGLGVLTESPAQSVLLARLTLVVAGNQPS